MITFSDKPKLAEVPTKVDKVASVSLELNLKKKISKSATFYTRPKPRFKRDSLSAIESRSSSHPRYSKFNNQLHPHLPQPRLSVETIVSQDRTLTFNFLPPVQTHKPGQVTTCTKLSGNRNTGAITRMNAITPQSLSHSITRSPVASSSDEVANMIQNDSSLLSNVSINLPAASLDLKKVYDRAYRPTLKLPKCSTMSTIKPHFINSGQPRHQVSHI